MSEHTVEMGSVVQVKTRANLLGTVVNLAPDADEYLVLGEDGSTETYKLSELTNTGRVIT